MSDLTILSFENLESGLWVPHISSDINPDLADAMQPTYPTSVLGMPNSLAMTNSSSKANGGGLLAHNIPFEDILPSLPYTQFSYTGFIPGFCFQLLSRYETDLTIVPITPAVGNIVNKVNMAMQYNMTTKNWQLTDFIGEWQDTGVSIGAPQADTPFQIVQKGFIDYPNKKFQVLSINGVAPSTTPFVNPIPWYISNWTTTINLQLQTEVVSPGALTTLYRGIKVQFSNQPF